MTLRTYLLYNNFTFFSDYSPLQWLINNSEPSARVTRWRLNLCQIRFWQNNKKGKQNKIADESFRLHTTRETGVKEDDVIQSIHSTRPTRATLQDLEHDSLEDEEHHDPPDLIKQDFDEEYHLLHFQEIHAYMERPFASIVWDIRLTSQFHYDVFYETRLRLDRTVARMFQFNNNGLLVRTLPEPPKCVFPHKI